MTMPHLMNCSHSETGWCLNCVKELWEEYNGPEAIKLYKVEMYWDGVLDKRLYESREQCVKWMKKHRKRHGKNCIIRGYVGQGSNWVEIND